MFISENYLLFLEGKELSKMSDQELIDLHDKATITMKDSLQKMHTAANQARRAIDTASSTSNISYKAGDLANRSMHYLYRRYKDMKDTNKNDKERIKVLRTLRDKKRRKK